MELLIYPYDTTQSNVVKSIRGYFYRMHTSCISFTKILTKKFKLTSKYTNEFYEIDIFSTALIYQKCKKKKKII